MNNNIPKSSPSGPQYWPGTQIPKSFYSELLTSFSISPENIPLLQNYYILYWDYSHFFMLFNAANDGTINHRGIAYTIIPTPEYVEWVHNRANTKSRLALSFRRPKNCIRGYVIVSPAGNSSS